MALLNELAVKSREALSLFNKQATECERNLISTSPSRDEKIKSFLELKYVYFVTVDSCSEYSVEMQEMQTMGQCESDVDERLRACSDIYIKLQKLFVSAFWISFEPEWLSLCNKVQQLLDTVNLHAADQILTDLALLLALNRHYLQTAKAIKASQMLRQLISQRDKSKAVDDKPGNQMPAGVPDQEAQQPSPDDLSSKAERAQQLISHPGPVEQSPPPHIPLAVDTVGVNQPSVTPATHRKETSSQAKPTNQVEANGGPSSEQAEACEEELITLSPPKSQHSVRPQSPPPRNAPAEEGETTRVKKEFSPISVGSKEFVQVPTKLLDEVLNVLDAATGKKQKSSLVPGHLKSKWRDMLFK